MDSSDSGTPIKRDRNRRFERRVNSAVTSSSSGSSSVDRKSLVRRRAGDKESTGANSRQIARANDHAITRASQLDRTAGHRENIHCHSKREGRYDFQSFLLATKNQKLLLLH